MNKEEKEARLSELSKLGEFVTKAPEFKGLVDAKLSLALYVIQRCEEIVSAS